MTEPAALADFHRARAALAALGIDLLGHDHEIVVLLHGALSPIRQRLVEAETPAERKPLRGQTFWEIGPKYRCDILMEDVPRVANQLAYAIGLASLYLPLVANNSRAYFPGSDDFQFWYHYDFGVRLTLSGWDRLALLLDLAFGLQLNYEADLKSVLRELPKKQPGIEREPSLKTLKSFRDGPLLDLGAKKGSGIRNEATHVVSPSTRFFFEFLDNHGCPEQSLQSACRRRLEDLMTHHKHLIDGIAATAALCHVESN